MDEEQDPDRLLDGITPRWLPMDLAQHESLCNSKIKQQDALEDQNYRRITLRIPPLLHASLMVDALANTRSMNAEVIRRLDESYQQSKTLDLLARIAAKIGA